MFREMRRKDRQLPDERAWRILEAGGTGVLSVTGDGGYPYAVPVNYCLHEGAIVFHGATSGHKFDAVARDGRASFCVIDRAAVVPEEVTTHYRSAIAFGRVHIIEDEDEKRAAALALGRRFSPEDAVQDDLRRSFARVAMFRLEIEHLTAKAHTALLGEERG